MDELNKQITRAQKGDKDAYGQIYSIFYKRIFRFCKLNVSKDSIAQDICQETFLKAWKSLPNFSTKGGSLQAYLFRIARNLIIDLYRKKKEERLENYLEIESDYHLEKNLEKQESIQKVQNALSKLKEKERQIITLRYFEDLSWQEVARVVGLKEGNLRVKTHRLLKKLKEILKEK